MTKIIQTRYKKRPQKGEVFSAESLTDKTGYVSNSVRIKQMMTAGQMLSEARKEDFDFPADHLDMDKEIEDVTRIRGIDLVDVMEAREKVCNNIRKKRKERIAKVRQEEREEQKKLLLAEINKELDKTGSSGGSGSSSEPPPS